MPGHAINYHPCPFSFTLDGYWTLARTLKLSVSSPIGADPLFSLSSHNPLRDGFCLSLRDYFTSTDLPLPVPSFAFKHSPYQIICYNGTFGPLLGLADPDHGLSGISDGCYPHRPPTKRICNGIYLGRIGGHKTGNLGGGADFCYNGTLKIILDHM